MRHAACNIVLLRVKLNILYEVCHIAGMHHRGDARNRHMAAVRRLQG